MIKVSREGEPPPRENGRFQGYLPSFLLPSGWRLFAFLCTKNKVKKEPAHRPEKRLSNHKEARERESELDGREGEETLFEDTLLFSPSVLPTSLAAVLTGFLKLLIACPVVCAPLSHSWRGKFLSVHVVRT